MEEKERKKSWQKRKRRKRKNQRKDRGKWKMSSEVFEGILLRRSMKKATFSKSWKSRMFSG